MYLVRSKHAKKTKEDGDHLRGRGVVFFANVLRGYVARRIESIVKS